MTDAKPTYRRPAEIGPEQLEELVRRAGERVMRTQGAVTAGLALIGLIGGIGLTLARLEGSAVIPGLLFLGMLGAGFGVLASQWFQPVLLPRIVARAARAEAQRAGAPATQVLHAVQATYL